MILALDISLVTGFAYGTEGNITFGTRDFTGVSSDCAVRGRRFRSWVCDLLTKYEPSEIVIEKPFLRNEATTFLLGGLVWEAHRAAELRNIPRDDTHTPNSIKKFIADNGRAKKWEVVKAVRERGYKVTNDHEADAVALLLLHEAQS